MTVVVVAVESPPEYIITVEAKLWPILWFNSWLHSFFSCVPLLYFFCRSKSFNLERREGREKKENENAYLSCLLQIVLLFPDDFETC